MGGSRKQGAAAPAMGQVPEMLLTRAWPWALLVALAAVLGGLRQMADYDAFYHLSIGREVWRLGAVPAAEFFLWPKLGEPAAFHEWGFGLVLYGGFAALGYPGVSAINAALTCATLVPLVLAAGQRPRPLLPLAALALGIVAFTLSSRLHLRPEMVLFAAIATGTYALERYRARGRWPILVLCPLVAWLLVQAHPSALFLFAVLGAHGLSLVVLCDASLRRRRLTALVPIGVATAVAALLNPLGSAQILEPVHFVQQAHLLATNAEFRPTFETEGWPNLVVLWVLIALSVTRGRQRDPFLIALMVAFSLLAVAHVRNIALLGVVAAVPVMRGLSVALAIHDQMAALRLAALATATWGLFAAMPLLQGQAGWGPWPERFPDMLTRQLERDPGRRLFNDYGLGGWLSWRLYPPMPVFIDGRQYRLTQSLRDYSDILFPKTEAQARAAAARLEALGIDRLLLQVVAPGGEPLPGIGPLVHSGRWRLTGQEGGVVLFQRADTATDPALPLRATLAAALSAGLRLNRAWGRAGDAERVQAMLVQMGLAPLGPGQELLGPGQGQGQMR